MKKYQFKLQFNEEKIKAIKVSLKDKNKNLDEEIIKFLDSLYSKNVPKLLKKYIEEGFETEDKTKEAVKEVEKEVPKEEKLSSETLDNNNKKY
ncbi:DUF6103 family protein [Clostridium estertheticum]|uniref:DUF6103 family protein n=1 Tax=Clostridium estertheticum TaxID=238834 RepID=UPI001CF2B1E1|nr:DUF6103 family protein [Clostridium estertheticum]MCB2309247.1 DUF6103 family protein [Clostridium estertheticum]MCB2346890.1 DUF6103 family protein [Clostridium estertheticum]MCB2352242.1 DUF6103 family protein [Clostridium estertheticum]WAG48553.1 DUF6103 family protein [Clostridium estertheticum]